MHTVLLLAQARAGAPVRVYALVCMCTQALSCMCTLRLYCVYAFSGSPESVSSQALPRALSGALALRVSGFFVRALSGSLWGHGQCQLGVHCITGKNIGGGKKNIRWGSSLRIFDEAGMGGRPGPVAGRVWWWAEWDGWPGGQS